MRLLLAWVQRLESKSLTCTSNQPMKEGNSKYKIPIFKQCKPPVPSSTSFESEITSFRDLPHLQEATQLYNFLPLFLKSLLLLKKSNKIPMINLLVLVSFIFANIGPLSTRIVRLVHKRRMFLGKSRSFLLLLV